MPAFDVGYTAGSFVFRDPLGEVSTRHPATADGRVVDRYDSTGTRVEYVSPSLDSAVVLCAERTGGLCYRDTNTGEGSWEPPEGSVRGGLGSLELAPLKEPFRRPPPCLDPKIRLGALAGTDWMLISVDAEQRLLLCHKVTGALRCAPWVVLRTLNAEIYFANLLTCETRWIPPHHWMEGWLGRRDVSAEPGQCYNLTNQPVVSLCSLLTGRRLDDRDMLPWQMARVRVDGGAPYLGMGGRPQYPPDHSDTSSTYPLHLVG